MFLQQFRKTSHAPKLTTSTHTPTILTSFSTPKGIIVKWSDGVSSCFNTTWLRDHCQCPSCRHPTSKQRVVDTFQLLSSPKPHVNISPSSLDIQWNRTPRTACSQSTFEIPWLYQTRPSFSHAPAERQQRFDDKILWRGSSFTLPTVPYNDYCNDPTTEREAMINLYQYGILCVSGTPPSKEGMLNLVHRIGFVNETLYGKTWTTGTFENPEDVYNDTASLNIELLHHTDCTYMRDPPALQVFNCVAQSDTGGKSRFADGFNVAEILRESNPEAFEFFCSTPILFECFDEGYHLQTKEEMIQCDGDGKLIQIRHNDTDRGPLTHLNGKKVDEFYRYYDKFVGILREEGMEYAVKLSVGDMIIVDNQRVMHGRYSFEGERALVGCYVGRDEYESKLRLLGIL